MNLVDHGVTGIAEAFDAVASEAGARGLRITDSVMVDARIINDVMSTADGKYAVFGHLISGTDVVERIAPGDVIRRMYVRP